jgi:L-threonylcarbamoyladenylate synthase
VRVLRSTQRSKSEIVAEVAACVRAGGTVVFPTDTVYGIGCDPENDSAIDAIFTAKGRTASKPLALHVTGGAQGSPYVAEWTELARTVVERFWPGPVAVILERKTDRFNRAACGLQTISMRCPDDDLCLAILRDAGPLAATSANRSGLPAFSGVDENLTEIPEVSLIVLAGPTRYQTESTIVDCTGQVPVILREGAVAADALFAAIGTPRMVR